MPRPCLRLLSLLLIALGAGLAVSGQRPSGALWRTIRSQDWAVSDWSAIRASEHAGSSGVATWRTIEAGNLRVRMAEYSPGYQADHWCSRGHVLLVLDGELVTELQDGRSVTLTSGMSYQVADGDMPHRSHTRRGAKLFVVD